MLHAKSHSPLPFRARRKLHRPHGNHLRALINPLEPFLRFRHRLDRSNPETASPGSLDLRVDLLPFIDDAQIRRRRRGCPPQRKPLAIRLEIAVRRGRRQKIDHHFDARRLWMPLPGAFRRRARSHSTSNPFSVEWNVRIFSAGQSALSLACSVTRAIGDIFHLISPARQSRVFAQLDRAAILVASCLARKQAGESSGEASDRNAASAPVPPLSTRRCSWMDCTSAASPFAQVLQGAVIGFRPALQGIDQRRAGRPEIQRADCAAIVRRHQRRVFVRREINFVAPIRVEIEGRRLRILPFPMLQAVRNRFRLHQGTPHRRAQMRRIEAAENRRANRRRCIARAAERFAASSRSSAKLLFAPAAFGQLFHFLRDVQHFLVHQIRLGILAEEIAPYPAAQERQRVRPRRKFFHQPVKAAPRAPVGSAHSIISV